MITKNIFVRAIMDLDVGQYIDVFVTDNLEEPCAIFCKKRCFGNELIIGKCPGDGSIFLCENSLYHIPEDTLEDYFDDISQYNDIEIGEPFEMKDWD